MVHSLHGCMYMATSTYDKDLQLWPYAPPTPPKVAGYTHFIMDEEYASREAHRSRSGEGSVGKHPPLTQEQMREMYDTSRMHVITSAKHGTRTDRMIRQQKMLAKFRWFTEDEKQAFR